MKVSLPRFSPNGTRVAYFDIAGSGFALRVLRLVVVGVDGSAPRVLRTSDQTAPATMWLTPPAWLSNDELAWVEVGNRYGFSGPLTAMRAKDLLPPSPQKLFVCDRNVSFSSIEQIEFFTEGATSRVVVSATAPSSSFVLTKKGGPSDLFVANYPATCDQFVNLTHEQDGGLGGVARDLAVSPDGALFAFASNRLSAVTLDGSADAGDGGADAGDASAGDASGPGVDVASPLHLWLINANASAIGGGARACSGQDPAADDVGPQWLSGGKQLSWMHLPRGQMGSGAIMIADVVGGAAASVGVKTALYK